MGQDSIKPGYVYFLHAVGSGDGSGMERYKIGLTTRFVDDRLKELNSGQSPFWLTEKWSIHVSDCEAVESALHQRFADRRLYFNTENGEIGPRDDIPGNIRKSTEWFVFTEKELDAVKQSYQAIQSQYPWHLLPPNLKQKPDRNTQHQNDRQWRRTTDSVFADSRHPSGGGGWGIALTLGAMMLVLPRMGGFAESVNSPRSDGGGLELPSLSMPELPRSPKIPGNPIDSLNHWIASLTPKLPEKNAGDRTCTTTQLSNIRNPNPIGTPTKVPGQTIGAGSKVTVRGNGEWLEVRSGQWTGKRIHSSMCRRRSDIPQTP